MTNKTTGESNEYVMKPGRNAGLILYYILIEKTEWEMVDPVTPLYPV